MARRMRFRRPIAISNRLTCRVLAQRRGRTTAGRLVRALGTVDVAIGACALRALFAYWQPSPTIASVVVAVALFVERICRRQATRWLEDPGHRFTADPQRPAIFQAGGRPESWRPAVARRR